MSLDLRKLGVLAGLAGLLLTLGIWQAGAPGPVVEASLATPGGITALPSGGPGVPGNADQAIPAIIRARAPGNYAVITVFCDPAAQAPAPVGLFSSFPLNCPVVGADTLSNEYAGSNQDNPTAPSGAITFEITRLYPQNTPPASTFHASGTSTLVCGDNAGCDLSATLKPSTFNVNGVDVGVVAVELDGGGANEILEVRATDELGESRSVQVVVIDTLLAYGPSGPVSTASQEDPLIVSYACDRVGKQVISPDSQKEVVYQPRFGVTPTAADADQDGVVGLDDLWDLLYGYGSTFGLGLLDNSPLPLVSNAPPQYRGDVDLPLYWCGGDTDSPLDDAVTFTTDLGLFSVSPVSQSVGQNSTDASKKGILVPPFVGRGCFQGKAVEVTDVDALDVWARALAALSPGHLIPNPNVPWLGPPTPQEGGCDLDFAQNGVVNYMLLGNGEIGTATIKAQQGGGAGPLRTVNAVFIGEPKISLYLVAPTVVGPEGGEFSVAVLDKDFRPIAGQTVLCSATPTNSALMVVPQTGTTGGFTSASPGQVVVKLVPTGKAIVDGEQMVLTCVADKDRSVKAIGVVNLSSTPVTEALKLVVGCNPAVSTWADDTAMEKVSGGVAPPEALDAIWALKPDASAWLGFSPTAPEGVNDLVSVNQLDAFFVCLNAPATLTRPKV